MTKMQKFKSWMKSHPDEIAFTTITVGSIAAFVALVVYATKVEKTMEIDWAAHVADVTAWTNEQLANGNQIYALADGRYLTVAADALQEIVVK